MLKLKNQINNELILNDNQKFRHKTISKNLELGGDNIKNSGTLVFLKTTITVGNSFNCPILVVSSKGIVFSFSETEFLEGVNVIPLALIFNAPTDTGFRFTDNLGIFFQDVPDLEVEERTF